MTNTKNVTIAVSAITTLILVIGFCLIMCIVSWQLLWAGCFWWECAPNRSFDILDLGLSADLFPADAVEQPIHLSDDDDPATKLSSFQKFSWNDGSEIANYSIDTYASNRSAQKNFELHNNSFFSEYWGNTKILWSKPEELTFTSTLADDFYVSCGTLYIDDYRCGMIAQYQEFVVFFNASISDSMSYRNFQRIIINIDEKFSSSIFKK